MVSMNAEIRHSQINGGDLKWKSTIRKNAEIEVVRFKKSEGKIHFHRLIDACLGENSA